MTIGAIVAYVLGAITIIMVSAFIGMGGSYLVFQWVAPNEFLMAMSVFGGIVVSGGLIAMAALIYIFRS